MSSLAIVAVHLFFMFFGILPPPSKTGTGVLAAKSDEPRAKALVGRRSRSADTTEQCRRDELPQFSTSLGTDKANGRIRPGPEGLPLLVGRTGAWRSPTEPPNDPRNRHRHPRLTSRGDPTGRTCIVWVESGPSKELGSRVYS